MDDDDYIEEDSLLSSIKKVEGGYAIYDGTNSVVKLATLDIDILCDLHDILSDKLNDSNDRIEELISLLSNSVIDGVDAIPYLCIGTQELENIEFEVLGHEYTEINVEDSYYAITKYISYRNHFYAFEYSYSNGVDCCSFEGWRQIVNYVPAKVEY